MVTVQERVGGQRGSAHRDCLHFRSRTSSSNDVEERPKALTRVGLSARSTTFSGSVSELDEQSCWTSSSASLDSNLVRTGSASKLLQNMQIRVRRVSDG